MGSCLSCAGGKYRKEEEAEESEPLVDLSRMHIFHKTFSQRLLAGFIKIDFMDEGYLLYLARNIHSGEKDSC